MNIAYFHGLESTSPSEKSKFLEKSFPGAYTPLMDYTKKDLFDKVLSEVKSRGVQLLIGSSMGGWFAYNISTLTGIPTLLFNPGLQGRSMEPAVKGGKQRATHTVVLGKNDNVIIPTKTVEWIDMNGIGVFKTNFENMTHRTPFNIFQKWVYKVAVNENNHILSFDAFLNENKK